MISKKPITIKHSLDKSILGKAIAVMVAAGQPIKSRKSVLTTIKDGYCNLGHSYLTHLDEILDSAVNIKELQAKAEIYIDILFPEFKGE